MARKPRIEFPGAFYHVMARGNHRAEIFRNDRDRERFLEKLLEYKIRFDFILYAYTLIPNHFHLLIETRDIPLSKIMQGVLQSHTQWFNRKYETVGHLYQGRYRAIICDKTSYLLALVRYLHINCIRAGIVKRLRDYRWSSHRIYLGIEQSDLIDTNLVLCQFSKNKRKAIHTYKSFMDEGIRKQNVEGQLFTTGQQFLGDESFIEKTIKEMGGSFSSVAFSKRDKSLNDISSAVKSLTNIGIDELRDRDRGERTTEARVLFVSLALDYSNCKRKDIAAFLHRTPKMVSYLEKKLCPSKYRKMRKRLAW